MPEQRDDWFTRLKSIEREYQSVALALHAYVQTCQTDPTPLAFYNLRPSDLVLAEQNVEPTYVVRLFALFESGLRSYWGSLKDTVPPSRDLIDSVASRRNIPELEAQGVHAVRRYRNSLVHDVDDQFEAVSLATVRKNLSIYLSRLPRNW